MTALHRKLFRDLFHMKGQVAAIALVIACGVASFVTMRAMYRSLLRTQQSYYAGYRFADLFAELKRAPDSVAARLREIPGVRQVQSRVVMDVTLNVPGLSEPAVGRLLSLAPQQTGSLNALFLRRGRFADPTSSSEIVASEAFATANHLALGSRVEAVIQGRWQPLTIVGIALSPEYIYEIRGSGSIFPDNKRFGVLWMPTHALEAALDMDGAFNSVAIALEPRADEADVIARVDRILDPYGGLGAYGRADQISHRFISDEIAQNRVSATIIPAIFLAVAALLVHFAFSRLVTMQRPEIAVLKAFGYSNSQLAIHYLQFSLLAALGGYLLGCAVGWYYGIRIAAIYADFYRFPILIYQAEPHILLWAGILTIATAATGALGAARSAATLPPAEAMRPEMPPDFRPRLMDRFKVQWMHPAVRMTLRNIERRPWRALASAFAICASIMIVVVEFGMFDALNRIMTLQFRDAQREDVAVTLIEARSATARLELARLPGVIRSEPFRIVPVRLRHEHRWRKTALLGLAPNSEMRTMIDQHGRRQLLPGDGIVLSTALADILHITPGETLRVELLDGRRSSFSVTVSGTVDEILGTNAYMDLHALNRLLQEDRSISGALLQVDAAQQQKLYQTLKGLPAIAAVSIKEAELRSFTDTIHRSMTLSIGTLLVFAIIIAVGMIYNGARIALSERARELSTLRVLGFTRREITFILLAEQGLITLFALPFGFLAGYALCAALAAVMRTELYRIPLVVQPSSYAWGFLIVLLSAIVSGIFISRRIAHLDIVSVLKARE